MTIYICTNNTASSITVEGFTIAAEATDCISVNTNLSDATQTLIQNQSITLAAPCPSVDVQAMALKTTTFALTPVSQQILPANPYRKYLFLAVSGTQDAHICPGTSPATLGGGYTLTAMGVNKQSGSEEFPRPPTNAFQAIASAAGSTLVVIEGM